MRRIRQWVGNHKKAGITKGLRWSAQTKHVPYAARAPWTLSPAPPSKNKWRMTRWTAARGSTIWTEKCIEAPGGILRSLIIQQLLRDEVPGNRFSWPRCTTTLVPRHVDLVTH